MITASVVCGGISGGAGDDEIENLRRYGRSIGLAFQVVDDILDETATAQELGKNPGKDVAANKMTYPRLMGIEPAKIYAQELVEAALKELQGVINAAPLATIAQYIVTRTH